MPNNDVGDFLPERKSRRNIRQLSPDDKAYIAHECFESYARGETWANMMTTHNITRKAAQTLVAEYAAMVREARPDTKTVNEEAYRMILNKAMDIIGDDGYEGGVLVKAKAFEAAIQSLTRLDKLGGHEAPNVNVNLEGQSLAEIVTTIYGPGGPNDGVDAGDNATLVDHEPVEEGDEEHGDDEQGDAD